MSFSRLGKVSSISLAVFTFFALHVPGDIVAEVIAVVPKSQITLEMAAAHPVLENMAAPIPHSEYGFGALPGSSFSAASPANGKEAIKQM